MSFVKEIKNVPHGFAVAVSGIKSVLKGAVSFLSSHKDEIAKDLKIGASVLEVALPQASGLIDATERASEYVLGEVFAALSSANEAATANGLNVTLDKQAVSDFRDLLAKLKASGQFVVPAVTVPAAPGSTSPLLK